MLILFCRSNCVIVCIFSVLDSFGRIPQLITQGNNIDFGAYDQCVKISEDFETVTINGKFCLGGLIVPLNSVIDIILPPGEVTKNLVIIFHAVKHFYV